MQNASPAFFAAIKRGNVPTVIAQQTRLGDITAASLKKEYSTKIKNGQPIVIKNAGFVSRSIFSDVSENRGKYAYNADKEQLSISHWPK
ncbi:MAG: hypothetical protein J6B09_01610 [Clostridia bacterium]|nr:hypothetical protein [Clostridia bacterium]